MLKQVSGAKLRRDSEIKERLEVKAFPGATTNCLKHLIQPGIPKKTVRMQIHCQAKNSNSKDTWKIIASDIIQLWKVAETENENVVISEICPHRDRFHKKSYELNQLLAGKH